MKIKKVCGRRLARGIAAVCLVFFAGAPSLYALTGAEQAEELMVTEKEILKEKEEAIIGHFYAEGERLLEEGSCEAAIDKFSRILEIDPKNKKARRGIKKAKDVLKRQKHEGSADVMAKKLLKDGKLKYAKRDYEGAIEDFQNALILDYSNKDVFEWLKKARHRQRLKESRDAEDDVIKETEAATQDKTVQERTAMLEVEKAYMPPEKPKREPVDIEEIISAEEEEQEKARRELLAGLQKKMVPAVSLTDADIRDVIRQLMEVTNVTIVIDEGALARTTGKDPLRLTFSTVTPMPLLEVLDIALRATELAYRVEPNYIWISTPEKLEKENMVTRTYRLRYGVRRIRKVELKEFESSSESSE